MATAAAFRGPLAIGRRLFAGQVPRPPIQNAFPMHRTAEHRWRTTAWQVCCTVTAVDAWQGRQFFSWFRAAAKTLPASPQVNGHQIALTCTAVTLGEAKLLMPFRIQPVFANTAGAPPHWS